MPPDTNKILKAEETLEQLASELERMKSAADQIGVTQQQAAEIIKASDAVITEIGVLISRSGDILQSIEGAQLDVRLLEIIDRNRSVESILGTLQADVSSHSGEIQSSLRKSDTSIADVRGYIGGELNFLLERLNERFAKLETHMDTKNSDLIGALKDLSSMIESQRKQTNNKVRAVFFVVFINFLVSAWIVAKPFVMP